MITPEHHAQPSRRSFLSSSLVAGSALGLGACLAASGGEREEQGEKEEHGEKEEEVSATEDLMREHGVLERLLLVYEEAARRASQGGSFDPALVVQTAETVRRFIEDYHEKLEEKFVFPRVRAKPEHARTVDVLLAQHAAGRALTDEIQGIARAGSKDVARLVEPIRAFSRMYRPHAAREDTVVFPALREILGKAELDELGEAFEDEEHERFGERGFETIVAEIAKLEASFNVADLASFTPQRA